MSINDLRGQDNPPLDDTPASETKERVKAFAVAMDEHGALYNRLAWRALLALNLILLSLVFWLVAFPAFVDHMACDKEEYSVVQSTHATD